MLLLSSFKREDPDGTRYRDRQLYDTDGKMRAVAGTDSAHVWRSRKCFTKIVLTGAWAL
jgi:hypothetical protein